ncbi:(2Fe-2S)-binding protein [Mycoplasmatota bacterium]|nr:(2Fe-2S)-binding protein [Mycoplasmatota bacterium]
MEESKNQCSTGCRGHCSSCHEVEHGCPVCGNQGLEVPFETVENLTTTFIKEQLKHYQDEKFYLCLNKTCHVAYFTPDKAIILLSQLNVPIWFKRQKNEYYVCYCRRITLDDIIDAVKMLNKEEVTISDVIKFYNKEEVITDCLHNNPTGLSCDKLFENAIKYAQKHK